MVHVEEISKSFGRREPVRAVSDVSFIARPGAIFGLLGPNGAGKTTTLRCIATLLRPDSGTITVDGIDGAGRPREIRARIGFLTGEMRLSGSLTPRETITFYADLNHVDRAVAAERIARLAAELQMESFLDRPVEKLSSGMKQKTAIAVSLIHDPSVIIFDEPTSGLDILAAKVVVDFLRESAERDRTVILSTHIMAEASQLCDEIGIMLSGRLVASGTRSQLEQQTGTTSLDEAFFALARSHGEVLHGA